MAEENPNKPPATSGVVDFVAGGVGGVCQLVVGHPLDTMKVKIASGGAYSSLGDAITKTFRADGFAGFYRGVASPFIGFTALNAVLFAAYGAATKVVRGGLNENDPTPYSGIFVAGCFAGVNAAFVEGPMDLFKAKMQAQVPKADGTMQYKSTFDCVKQIASKHGITGIYQGYIPTLIRNGFCNGTYFLSYEFTKRTLSQGNPNPSPAVLLLSGGMAGIGYWIFYPLDMVKTILQTDAAEKANRKYSGYLDCCKKVYARNGIRGFFAGFLPCMLRSFPANAACFYGYELTKQLLA